MRLRHFLIGALLTFHAAVAQAQALERVELSPMQHRQASLEMVSRDGTVMTYTPAELETFPTYRLRTTTPWRTEHAVFEGVMLRDLLEANGLVDVAELEITAINDFRAGMDRDVWMNVPVLVATRVNGKPHTQRERGPIQFVVPSDIYAASDVVEESHLVWMVARIESAD